MILLVLDMCRGHRVVGERVCKPSVVGFRRFVPDDGRFDGTLWIAPAAA
jgi:hypothetical protein